MAQRHVAIIQRAIPHYRTAFFSQVDERARSLGLRVTVFSAEPPPQSMPVAFCYRVLPAHFLGAEQTAPYWLQGLAKALRGSDVVVAPQELRCLNIPVLWTVRRRLCRRWIWWGHGYNFQAGEAWSPWMKDRAKGFMTRCADGLITYTDAGAAYWRARGLKPDRVRPFFNTIDVDGLRAAAAAVSPRRLAGLRRDLGLDGKSVLLFCGRLYGDKEVDFLLRALRRIQRRRQAALLIIGDGPERPRLEALAAELDLDDVWFLGEELDGRKLGAYFRSADLLTIPGLVGLAVVHGFAFGLPLVTTACGRHSPEIEYLSPATGVMTRHDETAYADAIERLLDDPSRLARMRRQATRRADRLRLAVSVERFVEAIQALSEEATAPPCY